MNRLVTVSLRVALLVLALGALLAQVLVPIQASLVGAEFPEVASLVVPYTVAAILAIACVEVALGVVWHLVSMVTGDRIFSAHALRWVDAITGCAAIATVLSGIVFAHLIFVVQLGGPGAFLFLAGCVAGGTTLVLLMVVMRGLLAAATADRSELAEVI